MKQFDARAVAGLLTVPVLLALFALANVRSDASTSVAQEIVAGVEGAGMLDTIDVPEAGSVDEIATEAKLGEDAVVASATDESMRSDDEIQVDDGSSLPDDIEYGIMTLAEEENETAVDLAVKLAPGNDGNGHNDSLIAVNDDTLVLLDNVTVAEFWGTDDKTVDYNYTGKAIIDLAGHTLDVGSNYLSVSGADASLIITDSVGGGKMVNNGKQVRVAQASNRAILTIRDGVTIESSKTAAVLVMSYGKVIVAGGTVINSNSNAIQAQSGGIVEVEDGVVAGGAAGKGINAVKYSTNPAIGCQVIVNGGEISGFVQGVYASGATKITINGGKIAGAGKSGVGIALFDDGIITMTNGEISGLAAIMTNGGKNGTTDAKIDIAGGKVTGIGNAAMYLPGIAEVTIGGSAEITGAAGLVVRGGHVTINDGATITADGENNVDVGDAGSVVPAGAVVVDKVKNYDLANDEPAAAAEAEETTTPRQKGVTINGGTFDGVIAYTNSKESGTEILTNAGDMLVVEGGSFSDETVRNYLSPEVKAQVTKQGTGMLAFYTDIEKAIEDSEPGDTIAELTDDGTPGESRPIVGIKINYNGYPGNTADVNVAAGSEYTLPDPCNGQCLANWVFKGWKVQRGDDSGIATLSVSHEVRADEILPKGEVITLDEDITLVAQWVDKTELAKLIADIEAEALEAENYTVTSWEAFQAALTAAKDVMALSDEEITQEAVNSAFDTLEAAYDDLETKQTPGDDDNNGDEGDGDGDDDENNNGPAGGEGDGSDETDQTPANPHTPDTGAKQLDSVHEGNVWPLVAALFAAGSLTGLAGFVLRRKMTNRLNK